MSNSPVTDDPTAPMVTLIVVPRERFSCAQASLEDLYRNTPPPFELIYVDGGSPDYLKHYLEQEAVTKGFQLIRTAHYLSPNQARNLGLRHARGRYVVFVDNDTMFAPGWLEALVECAEQTGAGVVGPLYFYGELSDQIVHMAGGDLSEETRDGKRRLRERHRHINTPYAQIRDQLTRSVVDFVEFHCMLVRRSLLQQLGPFDEELHSVLEHIDFCLKVTAAGGTTWLEPRAHMTNLATRRFLLSDVPYFMLRWCDDWNARSIAHFARRWNIDHDSPLFTEMHTWLKPHQQHLQLPPPFADTPDSAAAPAYCAQTNVQLYLQCLNLGYDAGDLALLRSAYECAQLWFGDVYRGCGKPFVAHLVGTASVLARVGSPAPLVAAGLLHSVYEFGTLGLPGRGLGEESRRHVAQRIGPRVEEWLYLYASVDWNGVDIATLEREIDYLSLPLAKVLLLRLANAVEECQDLSFQFSAKSDDTPRWMGLFSGVAQRLGVPGLAAELARLQQRNLGMDLPEVLRSPQKGSYALQDGRIIAVAQRSVSRLQ